MTEPYLSPPAVLTQPRAEHTRDIRGFQGIPSIELASSGRLWAAWYGGGTTEDRYNHVLVATSSDQGNTWSPVRLVVDPDGDGPVRAFDPCLWHDPAGRLWLFWAQGYQGHTDERSGVWTIRTEESHSDSPTWSAPERICDGIMLNKPTVLSCGTWLLPVARWREEGSAQVVCSRDRGTTWSILGRATVPQQHRNCDEHMIVERHDGSLWMLVRTTYGIGESFSIDRGKTWSQVGPSRIQHPTSRFFIRRLASGRLLLVKHGPIEEKTGRSHLMAFLSRDDGQTWSGGLLLDEREGVSYPDGVEESDETIYVIYDFDRRGAKEILMARFTEQDVYEEAFVSAGSTTRSRVNKATDTI